MADSHTFLLEVFTKWFELWSKEQRALFLDKLVSYVSPNKLFSLMENLGQVLPSPNTVLVQNCDTFDDQIVCVLAYVKSWTACTCNDLMSRLEEVDYSLVCEFYDKVALTVQEP